MSSGVRPHRASQATVRSVILLWWDQSPWRVLSKGLARSDFFIFKRSLAAGWRTNCREVRVDMGRQLMRLLVHLGRDDGGLPAAVAGEIVRNNQI